MTPRYLFSLPLAALLLGCSTQDISDTKDKAKNLADSVRTSVPTSVQDLERTRYIANALERVDIKAGVQAIHRQDLSQATAFCTRLDETFGTTIFTTYSTACERDLHESTFAAIQILDSDIANVDLPKNDRVALEATRDAAAKAKSLFNRDTFIILLLIYLDNKYPHFEWVKFLAPLLVIEPLVPRNDDEKASCA
jgi:hypothetical protein